MEMTHAPHIQQPRHPRHRETVRRVLDGAVEFRHFAGFDQLFAPHAHDYPVIGLVREGHRLMECNRVRHRLGPGQLLALNPGDAHGCVQEGAVPLVYDSLALLDLPDCPPFAGPIVEDTEAIALMGEAVDLMQAAAVDEGHLEETIYLLVGLLAATGQPDPRNDAAHAMAAHLRRHASETVRLEEVAAAAGLDKYRALRSFTAAFGLTPMRYLASLRAESAREALASGASCAEAALAAGFSDQAHLTRAFKERLGMTPGFYQRAVTESSVGADRAKGAPLSPSTPRGSVDSSPEQVLS